MPIRTPSSEEWFVVHLTGPVGAEDNFASLRTVVRRNGHRLFVEQTDDGERVVVHVHDPHPARELHRIMETADLIGYFYAEKSSVLVEN